MDRTGLEENGMRTRSFRFEDSSNRRAFLRSYPLQWGGEEEEEQQQQEPLGTEKESIRINTRKTEKKPIKEIILSVFHWGEGKFLVLRKFKNKLTVYFVACTPISFKRPTALITA